MYGHIKEDGITVSSDEDDHANILSSTKAMAKYLQTLKRVQRDRCRPRVGGRRFGVFREGSWHDRKGGPCHGGQS